MIEGGAKLEYKLEIPNLDYLKPKDDHEPSLDRFQAIFI